MSLPTRPQQYRCSMDPYLAEPCSHPRVNPRSLKPRYLKSSILTGPKPKGIKVETFRIDYLIRTPKVEKLSLQPISIYLWTRTLTLTLNPKPFEARVWTRGAFAIPPIEP